MKHQPPSAKEIYSESMRYIDNANKMLSEKGKKEDGYYQDKKYIRMACHAAYLGAIESLRQLIHAPKSQRMDILIYRNYLTKENKKMLNELDNIYSILHLYGGYDGFGKYTIIQEGLNSAIAIINWVKAKLAPTN